MDATSKDQTNLQFRSESSDKIQADQTQKVKRRLAQVREENNKNEESAQILMTESRYLLVDMQKQVEKCEDSIYSNEKTCMQIDADIEDIEASMLELEMKRKAMKDRKTELLLTNSKLDEEREKHRKDRISLEDDLKRKMDQLKDKKNCYIREIKSLEKQLSNNVMGYIVKDAEKVVDIKDYKGTITVKDCEKSKNEEQSFPLDFMQAQILQKEFDLLEEQIKKKESDLECPVCLETAQIPIYMCQQQHIICQHCLKKVMS